MERYESQCWDLFEDLAEKTLQLEPAFEKLSNSQFIASKGGLISLESFIVVEAKITTLMRKIEALETKEPAKVNQINPPPIHKPGCSYCQVPNHVFEECPVFQTHQVLPEHVNSAYSRPQNNSYSQTYNLFGEITLISLGAQIILPGPISPIIFTIQS